MNKVIWTCWFQGRDRAPAVVRSCLRSWERKNPGWSFRCLDATSIERYVALRDQVDLTRRRVTAASLSDIVRVLLLHEYGGAWVDASLLCNRPLDDWLPGVMGEGFFAFSAPTPDRPLSSWFLSAEAGHPIVRAWCRRTLEYWASREHADDYFWFHHLFGALCQADGAAWSRVPKLSADGPHALQADDLMYRAAAAAHARVDWSTPVFKLTHRLDEQRLSGSSLLEYLLERGDGYGAPLPVPPGGDTGSRPRPTSFASLKVSTENLGDHIQILSGQRLLSRWGVAATRHLDRDDEIRSGPGLDTGDEPIGILLNGWFKTNRAEWPPHPRLAPILCGFHIRLFQCPELVSPESIDFFRRHEPIGCRDVYTEQLLRSQGVRAFTSHCLSLTLPRRLDDPASQRETFVVSRDERIRSHLPAAVGPYTFVGHYSGSRDFVANMARAAALLETYRSRARRVITTLLHCALPAMAMGIPVVVFYPLNDEAMHASDRERFSSLEGLAPIHRLDEIERVDWNPPCVDVSGIKLHILDRFGELATRWRLAPPPPTGPIAPSSVLPPP